MALVKLSNNNRLAFSTLFDNLMSRNWLDSANFNYSDTDSTLPAVNIKESEDKYSIDVAAPGLKKENFKVKVENDVLSISSEKTDESSENNEIYSRKEFSYQSFQRTFNLPDNEVDGDKIMANYENGILHISLPKKEDAKPKPVREIKIS